MPAHVAVRSWLLVEQCPDVRERDIPLLLVHQQRNNTTQDDVDLLR